MAHALAGNPAAIQPLPRQVLPPSEVAQGRFLRAMLLLVVTILFICTFIHNRLFVGDDKFVYVFLICATAILVDRRNALYCAIACSFGYAVLEALEWSGVLAYGILVPAFRIDPSMHTTALWSNATRVSMLFVLSGRLVSAVVARTRRAESGLRQAHEDLARASEELLATQGRFSPSEKVPSLGTLVAGIAHELNNPTGCVSSNLDLLESYAARLNVYATAPESDRERLHRELRIGLIQDEFPALLRGSKEGVRRCREIVAGLRGFSRHKLSHPKPARLDEIAERALRFVGSQIDPRVQNEWRFNLNGSVRCFYGPLQLVLTNLLLNAGQAIGTEGTVSVETDALNGEEVFIRVRDTSCDMSEEQVAKIFDPFYTTKDPGKGMGFGLSVSYGIVAEHGGRIEVESSPGEGSAFTVVLPRGSAPGFQPQLLCVLQEGEIRLLGSGSPVAMDVRVVAATNRYLEREVETGRFRENLYYRFAVFPLEIPALRERTDDIPLLVDHFLECFAERMGRENRGVTPEAMELLSAYRWLGNVRELEDEIERALVLTGADRPIGQETLSGRIRNDSAAPASGVDPRPEAIELLPQSREGARKVLAAQASAEGKSIQETAEELEQVLPYAAIAKCGGNKSRITRTLGLSRTGLDKKPARYEIEIDRSGRGGDRG